MKFFKYSIWICVTVAPFFVIFAFFFCRQINIGDTTDVYIRTRSDIYCVIRHTGCFKVCWPFAIITPLFTDNNCGEYTIEQGETALHLINKILNRNHKKRKITFIEGATAYTITKQLKACEHLVGDFDTINDGDVFPDTYCYTKGTSRQKIVDNMKSQMLKVLSQINNKTNLTAQEIIVLASIIEKEAGCAEEMPIISSVFHNRLHKNMKLQSDVTVIYALTNGTGFLGRKLLRKDWLHQSAYNTYCNYGLPIGAICCPGKNALIAAANPDQTEYLYFVLNPVKRRHIFAKTNDEQNKNIAHVKQLVCS